MSSTESLTNDEIQNLLKDNKLRHYDLEKVVEAKRAIEIRRNYLLKSPFNEKCAVSHVDDEFYDTAKGTCCENIVGFVPLPLGIAGPILVNGDLYNIPIATTEGALVASLSRGCRAVRESGGIKCVSSYYGMTRAPLLKFPSVKLARDAVNWLQIQENLDKIRDIFDVTSRYAKLQTIVPKQAGNMVFIRVVAHTGEAMGMNMISKGCEKIVEYLKNEVEEFKEMRMLSLSGNFCVDKKPSAQNWINNRGYNVICDITIPSHVLHTVLKTTSSLMIELNNDKNLVGSSLAGCIGGNNAHSVNIVSGMYIATGQDVAQAGTSSMAMVNMEASDKDSLYISVTMPCIEVGTIGGGTSLPQQQNTLRIISPDIKAEILAQVVCSAVLAGEISLLAAMTSGDLVKSHISLNRKK